MSQPADHATCIITQSVFFLQPLRVTALLFLKQELSPTWGWGRGVSIG